MIKVDTSGVEPVYVDRIAPQMSVDSTGKVTWLPVLTDYNKDLYYRGKKLTDEEFSKLLLQDVYQGNYISDSLDVFFNTHLSTAIYREFTTAFNLVPSYVKTIGPGDWGTLQSDGYYYIEIPASEHGFDVDSAEDVLDKMNIDTEFYVLDETTGMFFEVSQVDTDIANTVHLFSDDPNLTGFVVIRTNDKAYALATVTIDATQVTGLANVATSAKYTDLVDINSANGPNTRIAQNATDIAKILSGESIAAEATHAVNADNAIEATRMLSSGTLQGQKISDIFETGSTYVKNATRAKDYDTVTGGIKAKFDSVDSNIITEQTRITNILNGVTPVLKATNAANAIVNDDGTYSGFTKTAAGVLQTSETNVVQSKILYEITDVSSGSWGSGAGITAETTLYMNAQYSNILPEHTYILHLANLPNADTDPVYFKLKFSLPAANDAGKSSADCDYTFCLKAEIKTADSSAVSVDYALCRARLNKWGNGITITLNIHIIDGHLFTSPNTNRLKLIKLEEIL